MTKLPCSECSTQYDSLELVPYGSKRVCTVCMDQMEADKRVARGIWVSVFGGPIAIVLAWATMCVPIFNLFAPFAFGLWALWNGVRSIQMARGLWGREEEMNVTPLATGLHLAAGILSLLAAFPPILFDVILWAQFVLSGSVAPTY